MTMSGTTSDKEWQRVVQWLTTSDSEWQRVTTGDNEWQKVTTSDTKSDSKWQWVTVSDSRGSTNENGTVYFKEWMIDILLMTKTNTLLL